MAGVVLPRADNPGIGTTSLESKLEVASGIKVTGGSFIDDGIQHKKIGEIRS